MFNVNEEWQGVTIICENKNDIPAWKLSPVLYREYNKISCIHLFSDKRSLATIYQYF